MKPCTVWNCRVVDPSASPKHISADYYYRIPVRPIYKSYPVYVLGHEPPGYSEWLKQQEPETVFDASRLKTEADWIEAGEIVFDAPIFYDAVVRASDVKDPLWYENMRSAGGTRRHAALFPLCRQGEGKGRAGHDLLRHVPHARDARRDGDQGSARKFPVRTGGGIQRAGELYS